MIKLKPIDTSQTFSIIPSGTDLSAATLTLTENGTNIVQTITGFTWEASSNGNYIEVTLPETGDCNTYTVQNPTGGTLTFAYVNCDGAQRFADILASTTETFDNIGLIGGASDPQLIITFVSEISTVAADLKEDSIYTLEIFTSTNVLYRDMVYVTNNENKNEVFSYTQAYTQHDDGDDEYIVL